MISKEIATKVLEKCLITGADFAEIFEEDSITNSISVLDDKVENILGGPSFLSCVLYIECTSGTTRCSLSFSPPSGNCPFSEKR